MFGERRGAAGSAAAFFGGERRGPVEAMMMGVAWGWWLG